MQSRKVYLYPENCDNDSLQTSVWQVENFSHDEDEYSALYDNLESVSQVEVEENNSTIEIINVKIAKGAESPALAKVATVIELREVSGI